MRLLLFVLKYFNCDVWDYSVKGISDTFLMKYENVKLFTQWGTKLYTKHFLVTMFSILVGIILCCTTISAAEYPPFSRLGIESGLSNSSIKAICQDHKGFIWFATYDGLNRYDGSAFKVFRNKLNDSTSLPHNYIYALHEDKFNNFWVGTGQGVVQYDNASSNFKPLYSKLYHSKILAKTVISANVISSDASGNLFVGTNGWGLLVKKASESFAKEMPLQIGDKYFAGYNVEDICVSGNKVWLFIHGKGLCVLNIEAGKVELVNDVMKSAHCLLPDNRGNLWLGCETGLYKYDVVSNTYVMHFVEKIGQLNAPNIISMCFDKRGKMWVGTEGGGLNILDTISNSFRFVPTGGWDADFSGESVQSIFFDNESRAWLGTLRSGCYILDNQKSQFVTIANNPRALNTLASNFIYSFCEDADGDIMVGTDGSGLSVWNRKDNTFKNYKHRLGDEHSLSYNVVSNIVKDYNGTIWAATFGEGINRFDKKTGDFQHYRCVDDSTGVEYKRVILLHEDQDNTLWASTFISGKLFQYNKLLNKFVVFDRGVFNIISMAEDADGTLWAGNSNHLIKIDKVFKQHQRFKMDKPVRALHKDKQGNFWVGTEGSGLLLFDTKSGKLLQRYSDADGLCNNSILNIEEDSQGNLWLSTFNGLSKFNPTTKVFKNFYQNDGLQSNQFSYMASAHLKTGELLFGGINGFNIFLPEKIQSRNFMPAVYLTEISVNSKPIGEQSQYISKVNNTGILEIKIPYHQAVLSFSFNALEYASPEKISFAYFLEGWDDHWNYIGNVHNINYNNLREGNYQLHIKNTNANGDWNSKEETLSISILPPWYRTWWAYLIYCTLIVTLLFSYYSYRVQQTHLKYKVKLAEMIASKEKEVSEKRQSFFTNITHEFRTPLTLIINPLRDLLLKGSTVQKQEELGFVYQNARRLLSLVDQLLLFRKTESETGNLSIAAFNFFELCQETFMYFFQQAKDKSIEYELVCENKELNVFGDREKLEIVLYNLLSNALKFTPDGGKIHFNITESEDAIFASVADSGAGIPSSIGEKLFEKFYQVKGNGNQMKQGFGIGLFLAKTLIDEHKGEINYTSKVGIGTTFHITLQKGLAHFGKIDLSIDQQKSSSLLREINEGIQSEHFVSTPLTDGLESIVNDRQSILITDDNAQMRQYLKQVFQQDYIVYESENGEDGLILAKEYLPDLIITDVVMHNMSGIEFCKAVKESPVLNHIPIILISGSFSPESKLQGIENGADDYITKPFEKDFLVARVQSLLRKQKDLQKYFYSEITHQKNNLTISTEYKEFLDQCIAIVEKHLEMDEFNIQTLASEIGMSHSKLYKKIKTVSGQSANAFIRFIRLRKAAELFINTDYNVNQTAFFVGIKDVKYFRDQFSKTFGLNPSAYIKKYRKGLGKNYRLNEKLLNENK